ncbi:hypothetical protein BGX33_008847 [Mortierella sp. NVP41]|nr:hypothetical protein BGX33_008847 [Mortierella sp. NVP41]
MSFVPQRINNGNNPPAFGQRPTNTTHRLDFSITSSVRSIQVKGKTATNTNDRPDKDFKNDGLEFKKTTRPGMLFQPTTKTTTTAGSFRAAPLTTRALSSWSGLLGMEKSKPQTQQISRSAGTFQSQPPRQTFEPQNAPPQLQLATPSLSTSNYPTAPQQTNPPPPPRRIGPQDALPQPQLTTPSSPMCNHLTASQQTGSPPPCASSVKVASPQQSASRPCFSFAYSTSQPAHPTSEPEPPSYTVEIPLPGTHTDTNSEEAADKSSRDPEAALEEIVSVSASQGDNPLHDMPDAPIPLQQEDTSSALLPDAESSYASHPTAPSSDGMLAVNQESLLGSDAINLSGQDPMPLFIEAENFMSATLRRADIGQQLMQMEIRRLTSLADDLQAKLKLELDKYHSSYQELSTRAATHNSLQDGNTRLQTEVALLKTQKAALEVRVAELQARIQELDKDRAELIGTQGTLRGQMSTKLISMKENVTAVEVTLGELMIDKTQWETESARLWRQIEELERDRDHLRKSCGELTSSFSLCSDKLDALQTAHEEAEVVAQQRKTKIEECENKCENLEAHTKSLAEQLEQQFGLIARLRQEVGNLEVAKASLSDENARLNRVIDYERRFYSSQEVTKTELRQCRMELGAAKAELDAANARVHKKRTLVESMVQDSKASTEKFQELTSKVQHLTSELNSVEEDRRYQRETIRRLQETEGRLEIEVQRLMNASMERQSDHAVEINATIRECNERFEELRECDSMENQALFQTQAKKISALESKLEEKTERVAELEEEKKEVDAMVEYQAQAVAASDRELLELRAKIQVLQSDHAFQRDAMTKAHDAMRQELESVREQLRLSRATSTAKPAERQDDPLTPTQIGRLHSRDRTSSSFADFLQWPLESEAASPNATAETASTLKPITTSEDHVPESSSGAGTAVLVEPEGGCAQNSAPTSTPATASRTQSMADAAAATMVTATTSAGEGSQQQRGKRKWAGGKDTSTATTATPDDDDDFVTTLKMDTGTGSSTGTGKPPGAKRLYTRRNAAPPSGSSGASASSKRITRGK